MKTKHILFCLLALSMVTACSSTGSNSSISSNSGASSQSQAVESSIQSVDSTSQDLSDSESAEEDNSVEESAEQESASEEDAKVYYTVSFDADGGSAVPTVSVLKGEKIPQPEEPSKVSKDCEYTFLGWYYEAVAWDFENGVVSEDMTLVAKWEVKEYYTNPFLPKD